jgi:large subunit ribosomal protein L22
MDEHVVKAKGRYIRMAPRKVRTVANAIRGKRVDEAAAILSFIPRRAMLPVKKVLMSALDAAKKAGNFDLDNLVVKAVSVDKGPVLRRGLPRARGMTTRINKFTSHLTVVLGEME